MHAHSLTRGIGARITRLHLPGNVHSVKVCASRVQAFVEKYYRRDLGNVMMSWKDLDVSRLQSGTPKEVVLMNYSVGGVLS